MFILWQSYKGFTMTVHAITEATKFLITEGVEFVLIERFCQDCAEQYFGNQRASARRCKNPDLYKFGYNNNGIRIQKRISCDSENTRGRHDQTENYLLTFLLVLFNCYSK